LIVLHASIENSGFQETARKRLFSRDLRHKCRQNAASLPMGQAGKRSVAVDFVNKMAGDRVDPDRMRLPYSRLSYLGLRHHPHAFPRTLPAFVA
jgi:hypothetical protein